MDPTAIFGPLGHNVVSNLSFSKKKFAERTIASTRRAPLGVGLERDASIILTPTRPPLNCMLTLCIMRTN